MIVTHLFSNAIVLELFIQIIKPKKLWFRLDFKSKYMCT